ncbi:PREDICTED: DNA-directed RNA polymerase III subunit 1 [Tarenaya hassleriana]|uniref:DNA-directed RNA polymerase III subunit 1 n=1 Tax=Tarenaya hassleriana TaxID=28532 RepID=UPI00053C50F1|nr:PREDICTED: DNA-directed RNA polymerase III subunit 1 [Tarenaya hassleriana]
MQATKEIEFTKKPYIEDVGPRRIKSIEFSIFSETEVMKAAEVQVWQGVYYDTNGKPIEGGLLDPRMGPPNKKGKCTTCDGNFQNCPGHYGYLKLALPVYNIGYFNNILDILKCICKRCSRMLLDEKLSEDYLKKMRNPKMESLKKTELAKAVVKKCSAMASSKIITCKKCGYLNGMVKKAATSSGIGISHDRSRIHEGDVEEFKSAISHTKESSGAINPITYVLNPVSVLALFKGMSNKDCELLYLADRPEKLIITSIAVPPISIRPSVIIGGTQSNENDITERLKRVIQNNASLRQFLVEPTTSPKNLHAWESLQVEVAQYINSDVRGVPLAMQPSKPLSGFIQRLKGKQGRFRGNLSGKRVEYTGRTVISPDPNLKITEVAIPILMARILTFPECVSRHNIEKLRQCVRNGPYKYPGARLVRYPDGSSRALVGDYRKRLADELTIGCIVDRHLEDGDVVLFNRQPSLHRMSIMCHRARIMPWRTLRFNESVCNPYNADFDGDEMNMHVPQTEEARTEAITLMGVQNNLCTPKNGEILVASTQDFLTSSFLITRKDTFYDRATFSLICSYMGDGMDAIDLPTPAILKPIELWTGKQIFGVLLRPNASVRVYVTLTLKEKSFKKGKLDEETMCPNDGWVYFRNSELISGQLGKATLGNGNKDGLYSVLLRDYNSHAAATCMNRLAKLSARWIGNHGFSIGIDDVQPGKELNKKKSKTIMEGYEECDATIQKFDEGKLQLKAGLDAAKSLEADITEILNRIREVTGKHCMEGLHWRNSPLIMSQCGSKGSPINISQMVACVGQQTVNGHRAPNGFIDRSLPHFPRMSKTPAAKGFVANSFYSGLSATEFFFHTMGGREGLVDTAVKTASTGYMSRRLMKALEDLLVHYDNTVRNANGCILQFTYGDDGMDPARMEGKNGAPLNFDRLFLKVQATCPPSPHHNYLSSQEVSQRFEEELTRHDTGGVCTEAFVKSLREFISKHGVKSENPSLVSHKASGVTDKQLEVFVKTCISRYREKNIEAGTAIGAIGAQSIGEPGTQMTLKTFHFAGVASMNITQGVPRINEIINASKNISTPVISAELDNPFELTSARWVKGRIEKTTLGQVAESIEVLMTSTSASVRVIIDKKRIEEACLAITPWSVKNSILKTPRMKLKENDIKVSDIGLDITPEADRSRTHFELHNLKNVLPNVLVNGIKTIERVVIAEDTDKRKQVDGKKRWKLFVEGTNLTAVMGTPGINGRNTRSNNVIEVSKTLGIEAARTTIIEEIGTTMGHHGMSIDIRHMMLLADVMTYRGEVLGITRNGIQKMDKSVLMQASFEKTGDHLFSASVSKKIDKIEGVTECVVMGIPMQLGTGILKVIQRTDSLPKLKYGADPIIS